MIDKGSIYHLETFITNNKGKGISGLIVTYKIFDSSTNLLTSSGTLTDIGSGIYQKAEIFNNVGQFRIEYITPKNYHNGIETLLVIEPNALQTTLLRVLGLSQENFRIFDTVYSGNNLVSATTKIYPSSVDVDADTNAIASYSITATYDGNNNIVSYKYKKN